MKNLEERIKIDQLKEALSEIFSEYGNIIDLVAKKNLKAKGQAFIVFDDVDAAQRAIEEVQGFELFDKPMVLDYAKTRSDAIVLQEGGEDDLELHKRKRLAEKGMNIVGSMHCSANDANARRRAETSIRGSGAPEEVETLCGGPRYQYDTTSQGSSWSWSEIIKSRRWRCHTRGVSTAKQDSLCAEYRRGRDRRRAFCDIWQI